MEKNKNDSPYAEQLKAHQERTARLKTKLDKAIESQDETAINEVLDSLSANFTQHQEKSSEEFDRILNAPAEATSKSEPKGGKAGAILGAVTAGVALLGLGYWASRAVSERNNGRGEQQSL